MAFLNFMKKSEKLSDDIDLDMPPEPPKMMEMDTPIEGPVDEELMMPKGKTEKPKKKYIEAKEDFPGLPPLPNEGELESLPELPSLSEEGGLEHEMPPLPDVGGKEDELPPPPEIRTGKKGFFSFLKAKKSAKDLELPKLEEDMPPLPDVGGKGDEALSMPPLPDVGGKGDEALSMPPLPELEGKDEGIGEFPEIPPLSEDEEMPTVPSIETIKAPVVEKPVPEVEEAEPVGKPIKKFITINDFKHIQGDIGSMKGVLKGVDDVFAKLEEVKDNGDKEYAGLYSNLKDIQTKIMFVDKSLFKEV